MTPMHRLLRRGCAFFVVTVAGCDTALVDGSYRGEPLLTVTGDVRLVDKTPDAPVSFPPGTLRFAVLWLGPKGAPPESLLMASVEQTVSLVAVFPAQYEVAIHTPPPDVALVHDAAGVYALAVMAAYVDTNENGVFDRDTDKLVGGATGQRAIAYAPDGLSAAWLAQPLPPGYSRVVVQGAVGQTCKKLGHVPLALDTGTNTELKVFAQVPSNLFPITDCDSTQSSFTAACPSPNKVADDCAKGKADPFICANCPHS